MRSYQKEAERKKEFWGVKQKKTWRKGKGRQENRDSMD